MIKSPPEISASKSKTLKKRDREIGAFLDALPGFVRQSNVLAEKFTALGNAASVVAVATKKSVGK